LTFSISHSRDLLLVAITVQGQVGVDVEWMDQTFDWTPVAETIFSRSERTALREVAALHRRSAFYSLWTRWEALSKAIGCGLSLPRAAVVPAPPGGNLANRHDGLWEGPDGGLWRTRTFTPCDGHVATVAHRPHPGPRTKLYLYQHGLRVLLDAADRRALPSRGEQQADDLGHPSGGSPALRPADEEDRFSPGSWLTEALS
jgi:hypothetical protein